MLKRPVEMCWSQNVGIEKIREIIIIIIKLKIIDMVDRAALLSFGLGYRLACLDMCSAQHSIA